MSEFKNPELYPFFCKRYDDKSKEWLALGTVHATDIDDAWEQAIKKWGRVDSVYDLYSCD
jgi:hypothetical protein